MLAQIVPLSSVGIGPANKLVSGPAEACVLVRSHPCSCVSLASSEGIVPLKILPLMSLRARGRRDGASPCGGRQTLERAGARTALPSSSREGRPRLVSCRSSGYRSATCEREGGAMVRAVCGGRQSLERVARAQPARELGEEAYLGGDRAAQVVLLQLSASRRAAQA